MNATSEMQPTRKKLYLASPYSHEDPIVRSNRVEIASAIAAELMEKGYVVFSPITHGHHIAKHLPAGSAHSHQFWMWQCLPMLATCDRLVVLPLSGWRTSKGLAEELTLAKDLHIPVTFCQGPLPDLEQISTEELRDLGETFTPKWGNFSGGCSND